MAFFWLLEKQNISSLSSLQEGLVQEAQTLKSPQNNKCLICEGSGDRLGKKRGKKMRLQARGKNSSTRRNALEVWPQVTAFYALLGNTVTATNLESTCGGFVLGISPEGSDAVPSP